MLLHQFRRREEERDLYRRRLRRVRVRCTQLRSIFVANILRIVPSAAFAGFVAPMVESPLLIASGASSASTTITGPSVMNFTSDP